MTDRRTLTDWANEFGISISTFYGRARDRGVLEKTKRAGMAHLLTRAQAEKCRVGSPRGRPRKKR